MWFRNVVHLALLNTHQNDPYKNNTTKTNLKERVLLTLVLVGGCQVVSRVSLVINAS